MKCPDTTIIGWLLDVLEGLDWRLTPLEVLHTEQAYPGLIFDLSIEAWQRKLVRQQIEADRPAAEDKDA